LVVSAFLAVSNGVVGPLIVNTPGTPLHVTTIDMIPSFWRVMSASRLVASPKLVILTMPARFGVHTKAHDALTSAPIVL
jgi:hypothetical protein